GGHKQAARALAKAFLAADPCREVRVVDALDEVRPTFRKIYTGTFDATVARTPSIYGAFFKATRNVDRSPVFRAARSVSNGWNGRRLSKLLRTSRPAAVVCTHFLPLEVALHERRAGRLDAPIFAVVTDYVAHGLWRQPEADVTFCPPGRAVADLLAGGVPRETIVRSGIPVDPVFGEDYDLLRAKRSAGLPLSRPTVVILAGGTGMGPLVSVMRATALATHGNAEIVAVCGRNERLLVEAAAVAAALPAPVRVLGFVDPIVDLLRGADVVVTKPGGLTTSECLALGKPLVFYEAAPGQESANARYAADRGAAISAGTPEAAGRAAARLLSDEVGRAWLSRRARRIARPDAARTIADEVLARVEAASPLEAFVA
ncbi:glycosyltransferase, partial [bacterium]|nr:glycosyltransferase [bacterium]